MPKRATEREERTFDFDVCLSFAGEDRDYVKDVAAALREAGVRVFYDEYAKVDLWGKDLYVHLDDVYRNAARYCVLFASAAYARKLWTNHERQSAQARAVSENAEYLLPVRFDETAIPGLRPTVGYVDLRGVTPEQLGTLIIEKVGRPQRTEYFPPVPDRLFATLKLRGRRRQELALSDALHFFGALRRMSTEERRVVAAAFMHGCPEELPENVHINIDLLRRYTGIAPGKLKRIFGGLKSLGFSTSLREDNENEDRLGRDEMLVIEWMNLSADDNTMAMRVAVEMLSLATSGRCDECAEIMIQRLNFANLASTTTEADEHAARVV